MQINKSRLLDAGNIRGRTRRIVVDAVSAAGKPFKMTATERVCSITHIPALNPAGSVIQLDLGNANANAEDGRTPYYEQRLAKKLSHGWLRLDRCPIAMIAVGDITWASLKDESLHGEAPCTDPVACAKSPCPHLAAEKKFRTAAHDAKMAVLEDRYLTAEKVERQAETDLRTELAASNREQAAAMTRLMERLGDRVEGDPAKRRKE